VVLLEERCHDVIRRVRALLVAIPMKEGEME
jgi:hypothetical protein